VGETASERSDETWAGVHIAERPATSRGLPAKHETDAGANVLAAGTKRWQSRYEGRRNKGRLINLEGLSDLLFATRVTLKFPSD